MCAQKRGPRLLLYGMLVTAYVLALFYRTALGAVKPDLEAELGLSLLQYSNLSAAFFSAYAIMQIPSGVLVDAWGPCKTAAAGMALMGAASMGFSMGPSYAVLLAARFLMGAGASAMFLAVLKVQGICFEARSFGTVTGVTTFAGNLGGSLSQLPMVYLISWLTWRKSFLVLGLFVVLLGVGLLPLAPGTDAVAVRRSEEKQPLRERFLILKNPYLYPPLLINLIAQGIFYCVFQWAMPFLSDVYGLDSEAAGSVASILPVIAAVSTLLAGRFSDILHSRRKVGIAGAALVLAVTTGLALSRGLRTVSVLLVLSGIAAYYSVNFGIARDVCPPGCSGMATALVNMGTFAGASLVPVLYARTVERYMAAGEAAAYQRGFFLLAGLAAISVFLSFLVRETHCENCWENGTSPLSVK